MRRPVIALSVVAVLGGLAIPSFAQPKPPVGAQVDTSNGVAVSTTINGQPGLDASFSNGRACVTFSLEVPFCKDVPVSISR